MRSYQLVKKGELNRARDSIYNRDEYSCQICGLNFKEKTNANKNIDHIIPRSAIAWSHPFNLQLLCENCNTEKGSEIPTDFLEVIFKNTRKTAKWFIEQSPTDDSKEEMMNYEIFKIIGSLDFDFENHYEVLALYYDDDYINTLTGMDLNNPDFGLSIPTLCQLKFIGEIDATSQKMIAKLILKIREIHSFSIKKRESKILSGRFNALALKLKIINENHLASKYRRTAGELKDVFRGGW